MKKIYYDAIYLMACGVNGMEPAPECLNSYRKPEELSALYSFCRTHFLEVLVGTTLKKGGVRLPDFWEQSLAKAIRKELLFDAERAQILKELDRQGIWYLPLKGILLKQYYPSAGMRQMSDNDILIDAAYADALTKYMKERGYEAVSVGKGNHDVYKKPPVYNFELHRALYAAAPDNNWEEYYRNIRARLCKDEGNRCGYHMREEDFYIYLVCHACKHYRGSGTGIRSLLDFYVYLSAREQELDFACIEQECEVLGIDKFEKDNRALCQKVFSQTAMETYAPDTFTEGISEEEQEMLLYYLTSGTYGTYERRLENRLADCRGADGRISKWVYYVRRIFPEAERYQYICPIACRHRWLLPAAWVYRLFRMLFSEERRRKILCEIRTIRKKNA